VSDLGLNEALPVFVVIGIYGQSGHLDEVLICTKKVELLEQTGPGE
jgi:hypothetical protein